MKINYYKVRLILFVLILTGLAGCGSSGTSPEFSGYKDDLKIQIQEMTNVLFGGLYSKFMSTYVDPSYINSEGGVDKAMLEFSNAEEQLLYKDLKIAKNISPLYNSSKKQMTYINEAMVKPITFKLINGKWYMMGDWFNN